MSALKGAVSVLLLVANTLFWGVPLIALTVIKLLTPTRRWRLRVLAGLHAVALAWIRTNNLWIRHWIRPQVRSDLPPSLSPRQWWLVLANHQSWTDILVMLYVLTGRLAMPKFFLKRELIFVPIVGLAWWALEFPFMRRYRREQLARNPALAAKDRRATERMCAHAREMPMTIYNFVEGTRFSEAKRQQQQSPYRHLLRPKAGGIAQVIGLLGPGLDGILDITLHYRQEKPSFWHFLCGKESDIAVIARPFDIPEWMLEGRHDEAQYKERFYTWLNGLWQAKDASLSSYCWDSHFS
ncbi:acyltransferase [Salinicola rhizosphaerae]|uniref:Acyltransferase n=1 Tax=Salinicola rhizosphaerae TaxID=1443141 RepID=A0ABQ3DPW7_9GAMM|nr:acyltransferase [Salinicola rhizosphaerae]GHB09614.1 acyltransferase [Salinicola rhizosphaerae]